jgi:hypothetical protein
MTGVVLITSGGGWGWVQVMNDAVDENQLAKTVVRVIAKLTTYGFLSTHDSIFDIVRRLVLGTVHLLLIY